MKKFLKLLTACLLLSVLTLNVDVTLALSKTKLSTKVQKVANKRNKRIKYKTGFFGGSSRSVYKNPLFGGGSSESSQEGCQELSVVSYNELSETSCETSKALSTALANATATCQARGCRRAINVSVRVLDTSVLIAGGNGRRYEYICGVVGNCTSKLF